MADRAIAAAGVIAELIANGTIALSIFPCCISAGSVHPAPFVPTNRESTSESNSIEAAISKAINKPCAAEAHIRFSPFSFVQIKRKSTVENGILHPKNIT